MTDHGVSRQITAELTALCDRLRQRAADAVLTAWEVGATLGRAKDMVRHGEWGDYLSEHFPLSARTSERYMRLAREMTPDDIRDMSVRQALGALSKRRAAQKKIVSTDLLDMDTLTRAGQALAASRKALVVAGDALEQEGVTAQHEAMRLVIAALRALDRLAGYLVAQHDATIARHDADMAAATAELAHRLTERAELATRLARLEAGSTPADELYTAE
jgi:hypothetical protein